MSINTQAEPMSVMFFTKYSRKGASSRYRAFQYIPYLERDGIRCTVSPLFDDAYLEYRYEHGKVSKRAVIGAFLRRALVLFESRKYDVLMIEGEIFPYLPAFATRTLSWLGVAYATDYDDAIFHQYKEHRFSIVRRFLGGKISRVMEKSALVVAGNDYLASYARHSGAKRVQVLPTVVDINSYPDAVPYRDEGAVFTIGWIGSPTTAVYLDTIAAALEEVCAGGRARVQLVGSGVVNLTNVPLEVIRWDEWTEVKCVSRFDVGIMPLPNDSWARGKCGLKLIQYMACGLPVVASPVGVNIQIVDNHQNGFLANDHQSWVQALTLLRDNHELCSKMGESGRQKVQREYSLQVTAPRMAELLRSVGSSSVYSESPDMD